MKVVVTGANGFIGNKVLSAVKDRYRGADIIAICGTSGRNEDKIRAMGVTVICDDRTKRVRSEDWGFLNNGECPDLFYDVAGRVSRNPVDKDLLRATHFVPCIALAELGCEGSGFVYCSSAGVYGTSLPNIEGKDETKKGDNDVYADIKLDLDAYFSAECLEGVVGVRPFNVYGPGDEASVAPSFVTNVYRACRDGTVFKSKYPAGITRDFVRIEDVLDGILLAGECGRGGQMGVFNLGSGVSISFGDIVGVIQKTVGRDVRVEFPLALGSGQADTRADLSLSKKTLGYAPRWTPEEGIRDYVKWLMKNNAGTDSL